MCYGIAVSAHTLYCHQYADDTQPNYMAVWPSINVTYTGT